MMFLILHRFLFIDNVNSQISNLLNSYHNINNLSFSIPMLSSLFFLSFLPAFILMATSFTRIIIVLGLLRNALGMPFAPPNQVLLGMSFFLTFFVMHPTIERIYQEAYIPYYINNIQIDKLIQYGLIPIHDFMIHQTRESDLFLFYNLSHTHFLHSPNDIPFRILLPAFVTSELKTAFQIGFTIMIPFLVIDLLVASVLISLGMLMIPPSTVSLPCKLILFVLVDGWNLLFSSLVKSFY